MNLRRYWTPLRAATALVALSLCGVVAVTA
ncbi:MAG: hypothetical protein JWN52_4194, partial [Actinomycetia bacterium]|nr:hypothetical protein [Actinomycetes bacterium]